MKKLLAILSFAILGGVFSLPAQAGFLVDPYLGYETGSATSDFGDSDLTGTQIGARLGYSMMGFWVGADLTSITMKSDSNGTTSDSTAMDMGLAGGYEFPILIRAYASYIFSSKIDGDTSTATGTGMKLGVGYTGLPFVALNLEMITRDYPEADLDSGGTVTMNQKSTTTVLSVSMPLDF